MQSGMNIPGYSKVFYREMYLGRCARPLNADNMTFKMCDNHVPVVVCAADNRYAMPLAVMLRSMADNLVSYPKISVWILDGGISCRNKRRIMASLPREKVELNWVRPSHRQLKGVPVFGHVSICTYYRLLMADLLPVDIHKAVYLDVDTLVLGDIGELWDVPLEGNSVLAVAEEGGKVSDAYGLAMYHELGLAPDTPYFNAGILVADIVLWRKKELSSGISIFVKKYGHKLNFWDQDILNGVFAGSWRGLDPKWNVVIHHLHEKREAVRKREGAAIIHFASSIKPWTYGAKHPLVQEYLSELGKTAWREWQPRRPLINWEVIRCCLKDKHWYGKLMRQIPLAGRVWSLLARWRKS